MALMCVACHTENRDAAKFCKGCGGRLVTLPTRSAAEEEALDDAWGATLHASLVDASGRAASSARDAHRSASRPPALRQADEEPTSQPRRIGGSRRPLSGKRDRTVPWILLAALAIIVATAGAYVYRSLGSRTGPASAGSVAVPTTPMPAPAAAPAAMARAPEPAAVPASTSPTTLATPATTPAATEPALPTRAIPRSAPPRKAASASASAPLADVPPVASAIVPAAEPAPVSPPVPADPDAACAGRNFIATAQCLAAQCDRPEFSAHARCSAVRRQQQIDEEKRNPVNAG